jgi:nucleoside-diphosphate-sugar epimerase
MSFKQRLRAECPYFDETNGFFHPDTPHPRYIITGGAGFIGSHLIKALREQEGVQASQIKVVDNLWRGRLANLQFPNGSWAVDTPADFCVLDLRNEDDTMKYIRGADYIYHLADIVAGVAYVFSHQESVFHDNILINTHTLKAAKEDGIKNYLYVGTA